MVDKKVFTAVSLDGDNLFDATVSYGVLSNMSISDLKFYPIEGVRVVKRLGHEFYNAFVKSVGAALDSRKYPKLITKKERDAALFQAAWDMVHLSGNLTDIEFVDGSRVDNDMYRKNFLHGHDNESELYIKFCEEFEELASNGNVKHGTVYRALKRVVDSEGGRD